MELAWLSAAGIPRARHSGLQQIALSEDHMVEAQVTETRAASISDALRSSRQRAIVLTGQLERNQGQATFTGRLTLEQFADLTVVHNRKWAEDAGEISDEGADRP